jgi:hypothetical protein
MKIHHANSNRHLKNNFYENDLFYSIYMFAFSFLYEW